jgi:hypothetical protein
MEIKTSDYIETPYFIAYDMVKFFKPIERILDPCRGKNKVFYNILRCNWCEILEGVDFFNYTNKVDWIIGNPPYSIFNKWIKHSYKISENIVYLLPLFKVFNPLSLIRLYRDTGHVKHIRFYDVDKKIPWSRSRPICAIYFKKDYFGDTSYSYYKN